MDLVEDSRCKKLLIKVPSVSIDEDGGAYGEGVGIGGSVEGGRSRPEGSRKTPNTF